MADESKAGAAPGIGMRLLQFSIKHRADLAAVAISLVAAAAGLMVEMRWPHPSGGDPGQWLTMANTYLGRGISNLTPLQYPPFYFLVLSTSIVLAGSSIGGLYLSLGLVLFFISLSSFYCYRMITSDTYGALIFAALVSFSWTLFDMVAWGGYPNLSSFPFYLMAMAFLFRTSAPDAKRRDFLWLGVAAGMIFLSHPLTTLIFGLSSVLFFALLTFPRFDRRWINGLVRFSLPLAAAFYLPFFALQRIYGVSSPEYISGADIFPLGAAYHPLVPWFLRPYFPFDPLMTLFLSLGISAGVLLPALRRRGPEMPGQRLATLIMPRGPPGAARRAYALFVATLLPPLLFPIALWSVGLNSDFGRTLYFALFPFAAAGALLLSRARDPANLAWFAFALRRLARKSAPAPAQSKVSSRGGRWARVLPFDSRGEAAVVAATALFVAAMSNAGIVYLGMAAEYYVAFTDSNDNLLTQWIRENTPPDADLLVSPEYSNQLAYNWLGGLTGRRTTGYTEPVWLFYHHEELRNFKVYQMFANRYSLDGPSLEVSSQGIAPFSGFQLRVSALDKNGAYGAFDILDTSTAVEMQSGARYYFNNSGAGNAVELFDLADGRKGLRTTTHQPDLGITLTREAFLDGEGASVHFSLSLNETRPVALVMTAFDVSPICGLSQFPGGVIWSLRTPRDGCKPIVIRGPSLDESAGSPELRWPISDDGLASGFFESPLTDSGFDDLPSYFDSAELYRDSGLDYIVLLKVGSPYWLWMIHEYSFAAVYENAKYLVLRNSLSS